MPGSRLAALRRSLRELAFRTGLRRRPRRVFARRAVWCEARLDVDAGTLHVRVCDVSGGGALLELAEALVPGARAQLRFPQLPGRPAVWCTVQHALPEGRRMGVRFQGDPDANARLAEELVRRHGAAPPAG
jgi:hypothetical protein